MIGDAIVFEGVAFRRDPEFDGHEPGVLLLLYRLGAPFFRECATVGGAMDALAIVDRQIDEDPAGIAEFAPHAIVRPDGAVVHRGYAPRCP